MEVEDNVHFVIDNVGGEHNIQPDESVLEEVYQTFIKERNERLQEIEPEPEPTKPKKKISKSDKEFAKLVESTIKLMGVKSSKGLKYVSQLQTETLKRDDKMLQEVLAKSDVLKEDFETLKSVPSQIESERKVKQLRRLEKEKSKGKHWFNMPATEVTDEIKKDLEVLQMRSVLDPKHFYKKNDLKVLPKYFQVGKVLDSPLDYYNNRLTKKERKQTLVDELLADAEFCKYNKKKYTEVLLEKQKTHYKAYKQAKRLKHKNKK